MEEDFSPVQERVCSEGLNKKRSCIASTSINFLTRGLQEESLVKDSDDRILHSTRSATREFAVAHRANSIVKKVSVLCYCSETSDSVNRASQDDVSVFECTVHALDIISYRQGHHLYEPSSPTSVHTKEDTKGTIDHVANQNSQFNEDADGRSSECAGDVPSPVFRCMQDALERIESSSRYPHGTSVTCRADSVEVTCEYDVNTEDSQNVQALSDCLRMSVTTTLNDVMAAFMDDAYVDEEMNTRCDHACRILDGAEIVVTNCYDEYPYQDEDVHENASCYEKIQDINPHLDASNSPMEVSSSARSNLMETLDVSPLLGIEDQSIGTSEVSEPFITHGCSEDLKHSEPLLLLSSKGQFLSTLSLALQVKHDCDVDDPDAPSTPDLPSESRLWKFDEISSPEEDSQCSEPHLESPSPNELLGKLKEEKDNPASLPIQHLYGGPEHIYEYCSPASEQQEESPSSPELLGKQNEKKDKLASLPIQHLCSGPEHIYEDCSYASEPQEEAFSPNELLGKQNEEKDIQASLPIQNTSAGPENLCEDGSHASEPQEEEKNNSVSSPTKKLCAGPERICQNGWEIKCKSDTGLCSRIQTAKKMAYVLKVLAWKNRASSRKSHVGSKSHSLVLQRFLRINKSRCQEQNALSQQAWLLLEPFLTTKKARIIVDYREVINLLLLSYRNTKQIHGMEGAAEDYLSLSFKTLRKCTIPVMQLSTHCSRQIHMRGQIQNMGSPVNPVHNSKDLVGCSSHKTSQSPDRSLKRKEDWNKDCNKMQVNPIHDSKDLVGSSSRKASQSPARSLKRNEDWNNIQIDQTEECLDTCLVHLQPAPVTFPFDFDSKQKHYVLCESYCSHSSGETYAHSTTCVPRIPSNSSSYVEDPNAKIQIQELSRISTQPRSSSSSAIEKQSKQKLQHFAEVFLLRRHIIQQQRRAQRYPPFPPQDAQHCQSSRLSDAWLSMDSQVKDLERGDDDTSLSSRCTSPEFTVDVCELQKLLDTETTQLGSRGSVAIHESSSEPDIPNLATIIVTIVTVIVYTRIFWRQALSRVGVLRTDKRLESPEP